MEKSLKTKLESDENPVGTWVSVGDPTVAEASAHCAFDFLLVDTEHTSMSLETVENMTRAVEAAANETETLVRIPSNDPVRVKRVLDIGVSGVMVPMVETVEEAEKLVSACRYPPDGIRGIAGGRASGYGRNFEEYVASANDSVLTVVQIETRKGVENAEEIAQVDGVDALFVGPADLSGALGVFAEWNSTELSEAISDVIDAGNDAGIPVGTLALRGDDVEMRVQQGFDFLIVGKDTTSLMEKNRELRRKYENSRDKRTIEQTADADY